MKYDFTLILLLIIVLTFGLTASLVAADRAGFDQLTILIDSARVLEAHIFAPKVWQKVDRKYEDARKSIEFDKKQKSIDKLVNEAREYAENALRASEVGRLSLQEYLAPRDKAINAKAPSLVSELYLKAEQQFIKATAKVEKGDVKGGLKEAAKSSPLFKTAEIEGIRADILGGADRLISKAIADDAKKYALSTLDKAQSARSKANAILTSDRYNRIDAIAVTSKAEYEAKHASNIALSVRSLNRNDQAWEKLMLVYEIQMNRVGKSIGVDHLPFDKGPLAAADTLINYINNLQAGSKQLDEDMSNLSSEVTSRLNQTLVRVNKEIDNDDPVALATSLDKSVADLLLEIEQLKGELIESKSLMAALVEKHEKVTSELSGRVELEEKFKEAKTILNPSEGEVLFNSSNDIVLRLGGLSFAVGKSEIQDEHIPLLEKVKKIIQMFPESQLVVEGHTDASGEQAANVTLSEKRAFGVMQYLRQSLMIPANQIQSMGYGADKPIASNQTKDGRAKNRRIDIILMR